MPEQWDERYTPADAEIIRWKVLKIVGQFPFLARQQEDLLQEVAMHVSRQTCRVDPTRRREAFVATVAENKLLNIVAKETAQKRDTRRDVRIHDIGEGLLLDGTSRQEDLDMQLDIRDAIEGMPPDMRLVAMLRQELSEAEVLRRTGFSREEVRGIQRRIAAYLRDKGLGPTNI